MMIFKTTEAIAHTTNMTMEPTRALTSPVGRISSGPLAHPPNVPEAEDYSCSLGLDTHPPWYRSQVKPEGFGMCCPGSVLFTY